MEVQFDLPEKLRVWLISVPDLVANFECDGCSGVVDSWFGIDLFPSCELHDWGYALGRNGVLEQWERKNVDKVFWYHTRHLLLEAGLPKWYCHYFASRRYWAVRWKAAKHFKRVSWIQPLS